MKFEHNEKNWQQPLTSKINDFRTQNKRLQYTSMERLKRSYDDIISAVDTFLTNGIQALWQRWKKYGVCKEDYVEKQTSFCHIPWEYLGQLIIISDNSFTWNWIIHT